MSEGAVAPARENSEQMSRVARAITDIVPDGTGFLVLTFPLGGPGVMRYAANGNRADCMNMLKEFMIKTGHSEDWMKHL